ncbi:hypothetical protein M9Y10_002568 [Tritrichomonas musculus]|uniref:Initiator binding domain-containing protein n=1 Tax=Tritrichomonas musculus TaxID=1915356 RepID=A0ABR2LCK3_9EUKA
MNITDSQESMKQRVDEICKYNNDTYQQICTFLKAVEPRINEINANPKTKFYSTISSFKSLLSIFNQIRNFIKSIQSISKPTQDSLADEIKNNSEANRALKTNIQEFVYPNVDELNKYLAKNHELNRAIQSTKLNYDNWFALPPAFLSKWEVFWKDVLKRVPVGHPNHNLFQQCRVMFQINDPQRFFKDRAEQYKKELDLLKQCGKQSDFNFKEPLSLYTCVKGFIITGTIDEMIKIPAYLFLFREKLVLLNTKEKTIKWQNPINAWLVNSTVFPEPAKVIDVLGTDYSFPFQAENPANKENLWKYWNDMMGDKPQDFGIYQPVRLDMNDTSDLDWVEINE